MTSLSLLLVLELSAPPRVGRAQPANVAPEPAIPLQPVTECERLYVDGQYLTAARRCEAEGSLYAGGVARLAAGHDALAVDRWRTYLAAGNVDPERRADLELRIEQAGPRMVTVRLETDAVPEARTLEFRRGGQAADALVMVWPAGRASLDVPLDEAAWTVELRGEPYQTATETLAVRRGSPQTLHLATTLQTAPVRVRMTPEGAWRRGVELTWAGTRAVPPARRVQEPEAVWNLPKGPWTLRADARGYLPKELSVALAGPQELTLKLERDPRERVRIGVGAGLGAASAILLGVGAGATAWGAGQVGAQARSGNLHDCTSAGNETEIVAACQEVADARLALSLGVGLLGTGLGATIPAALAASGLSPEKVKTEATVGAVLFGGSLAWVIAESYLCDPADGLTKGDLRRSQVAAGVLGASTMILSGALIHLLADRLSSGKGRARGSQMARRSHASQSGVRRGAVLP